MYTTARDHVKEQVISLIRRISLAAYVALRIVRSRRSPRLSAVTLISVAGVAFGVMALTIVMGVTSGFQSAFQDRILGLYPHVVVLKRGGDFRAYEETLKSIRETPGVVAAAPSTYDDMMMAAGGARAGAVVKGVDLASVDQVIGVRGLIRTGTLESLQETPTARLAGDDIHVEGAMAGMRLTVAIGHGEPSVLQEDRTRPQGGDARVTMIDLRSAGEPMDVRLEPLADRSPSTQDPKSLGLTRHMQATPGQDIRPGTWRLEPSGEVIELRKNTVTTLVFEDDSETPGRLGVRQLVESARLPVNEFQAAARVVYVGGSKELRGLHSAPGLPIPPKIRGGEHTGYSALDATLPGALLGSGLAEKLGVGLGDEISLVTPLRGVDSTMIGPVGMMPSQARHQVTGIFESGFHEYDVRLALVNLRAAQRFLNRGDTIRWIEVRTEDALTVGKTKNKIVAQIDPYELQQLADQTERFEDKLDRYLSGDVRGADSPGSATALSELEQTIRFVNLVKYQNVDLGYRPRFRLIDWQEMNSNLFSALKLQKIVLTIFFLIIIVVGSFVVVGSQVMIIHERTAEIAILRAMGATAGVIRMIFTLQGLFVTTLGTTAGLAAGVGVTKLVELVDYRLDASVYLIDRLPVSLSLLDLVGIALATALCTLAATQYSAGRAAAKIPVDGLRAID
jgi:ABC-type lipoprotein release transport system permease subunit